VSDTEETQRLTSMRNALILLMLLGLASIPGSLVPQTRVDPRSVSMWKASHPSLSPLYDKLGLFHVYGSAWFSAIYILLMISLVGCILPRLKVYWRSATAAPPNAPRNLGRLSSSASVTVAADPHHVAAMAVAQLRQQRFRTVVKADSTTQTITVSAQRGYLREAGNLLFHSSLIVVLIAFTIGDLLGYRGGFIVIEGQTFTNTQESYDDFAPGRFFHSDRLPPFSLTLDRFNATFLTSGPSVGQPTAFSADLAYRAEPGATERRTKLEVNHPLSISGTDVFLIGNGYAPVVTIRDGKGKVVYSGPTVFFPENSTYSSGGVIKVPDAKPTQIGLDGRFLPTYGYAPSIGTYSQFPDPLAPVLAFTVYTGDLGLGNGVPQSVYALNQKGLTVARNSSGKPLTLTLPIGQTRQLPNGAGTITFNGLKRWAKLQASSTPAERFALGGVVFGLLGLLGSLYIRPRRIWVRARATKTGSEVDLAGLDLRPGHALQDAINRLRDYITKADQ
jgi:cytochrome c biogenesis protein